MKQVHRPYLNIIKIIPVLLLVYLPIHVKAQCNSENELTSKQNGLYLEASTWNPECSPKCNLKKDLIIEHTVTVDGCSELKINAGYTITIKDGGELVLNGDAKITGQGNFIIESGGSADISGDVDIGGQGTVTVDGSMNVDGDVTKNGGGTFDGSGTVTIGGTGCENFNGSGDCGDSNNPLPVELVSFQATHDSGKAIITWQTATELNNDFFSIQRSNDGLDFNTLGKVNGIGTTNNTQEYTFTDESPLPGQSYYRLKQTDFDGTTETFKPILFENKSSSTGINIVPNPVSGEAFTINVSGISATANLKVLNLQGETVFNQMVEKQSTQNIAFTKNIKPGIYIAILNTGLQRKTFKFIKQ